MILEGEIKDTKVSRFSADFQTRVQRKSVLQPAIRASGS